MGGAIGGRDDYGVALAPLAELAKRVNANARSMGVALTSCTVPAAGKPTFDASGTRAYDAPPARWKGECTPGEGFELSHCNNKLIGARYYNAGYGGNEATKAQFPYEFLSPRDFDGLLLNVVNARPDRKSVV